MDDGFFRFGMVMEEDMFEMMAKGSEGKSSRMSVDGRSSSIVEFLRYGNNVVVKMRVGVRRWRG